MVRTIIEARFGVLLKVSVRVRDCLFKIEDLSTIDPEFPNRSRNIPNFSFIKWWNGSRVLRKEFHLNSKDRKQRDYLQFIYSKVEEVCSMSLSALTLTNPSRSPLKVLKDRAVSTAG